MQLAPGARVLVRTEEWIVRNVEPCDLGGDQLDCIGVSETVRHREAVFLSEIDDIAVLDPRETDLVADASPGFLLSRLYVEARLRQTVPTDRAIALGHRGAMDTLPFQLEPTRRALGQLRPRFLIADSVGLGKTLEAGILVSELMRRGKGRRILVVTTKSMMTQFQKEFWTRFAIPLTRLDSAGIQRIKRQLPANHNPFHYYDKTIISVDTLKRDTEYRHHLETAHWDVIVIDEAHNVSFKGNRTLSNRLAMLLASRSDALILLTATPHNGDRESFASLMRMLDPTVLPKKADYTREDIEHLFVRRFKKDVRDEIRQQFPDRKVFRFRAKASAAKERAFGLLADLKLHIDEGKRGGGEMLFRTTLEKALLSSPPACAQTLRERLNRLRNRDPNHPDIRPLTELREAVEAITPADIAKLGELSRRLREPGEWHWTPDDPTDRLVVFTERIETLKLLRDQLGTRLGLKANQVAVLHGQLPDADMQTIVEDFGKTHSPLRLLIASDVASEGLNLHFQSHRLVHYDIPWSLMVFQQRNGRVDRYGQTRTPLIAYLSTDTAQPKIGGDVRILDILITKDEQAARNIGDPSIFMGLYDEAAEALRVAQAIESGESAEDFAAALQPSEQDLDWLDALMAGSAAAAPPAQTADDSSLFVDDYDYLRHGLAQLHAEGRLAHAPRSDDHHRTVQLQPDDELDAWLKHQLAPEMRPQDGHYTLTANAETIKRAILDARDTERWPQQHYLWPLHPLMQWLDFKLLSLVGRQKAPVIRTPRGLAADEALILLAAVIPNRRGQPVLNDWFAVRVGMDGQARGSLGFDALIRETGFGREELPNARKPFDAAALKRLLPVALEVADRRMKDAHARFSTDMRARASAELDKLEQLRNQHRQQLDLAFRAGDDALAQIRARKREHEAREIDRLFTGYKDWVRKTLELDARAHLTVAAVLIA
ncbi:MAG: DEAD/DEAH box helicase [Pseudomonadota bacterium]